VSTYGTFKYHMMLREVGKGLVVMVVLPDPFRGWRRGGTPRRPNSRVSVDI